MPVSSHKATVLSGPNPKSNLAEFEPFYDRIALHLERLLHLPNSLSKVLVSAGLGLTVFMLQWLSLGDQIYKNSAWMLAFLIFCAVLFQYYATATFRNALPEIKTRLGERNATSLFNYVSDVLSDRNFAKAGLFFGALNTLMGILFGLPSDYRGFWPAATSYSGFFVAGFVCGVPVWGIYGVWRVFEAFAKDPTLKLSFTAHDDRGGMEFVGVALIRFAAVTLTEGVLIAWYILHMRWLRQQNPYVNVIYVFWVAWPFILSTFALLAPCLALHQRLGRAKREEDDRLQDKIREVESKIDNAAFEQTEALLKKHEYYKERRAVLDRMRTWPYDYSSSIKYGGIVMVNVLVAIKNASEHYETFTYLRSLVESVLHS